MVTSSRDDSLDTLATTIKSLKALLHTFSHTLCDHSSSPIPTTLPAAPPNPLALLSSASKVLKAQTTKLSLLVITKPFTASEINHVLVSISTSCLPALVTVVELLRPEGYTLLLHQTVRNRVREVLKELEHLVEEIPIDERGVERLGGRDTLASTGVLWEGCDGLVKMAENGLRKVMVEIVEGWKGLFGDAIEELEEWRDGEGDEDIENVVDMADNLHLRNDHIPQEGSEEGDPGITEGDSFETTMPATNAIRPLITQVLQTLNIIRLLYPALIKRRFRRFPNIIKTTKEDDLPAVDQAKKVDALIGFCELFSTVADEMAGSLYLHNEDEVMKHLTDLKTSAKECVKIARGNWDGEDDEFSLWVDKWLIKFDEIR